MNERVLATFWDPRRHRVDEYDFGVLLTHQATACNLRDAFVALTGHYERTSRRQAWRSIRKFATFLNATNLSAYMKRRRTMLDDFAAWLRLQNNLRKTAGSHFNFIHRVTNWLVENSELEPWCSQILNHHIFGREAECTRSNDISKEALLSIVAACKKEMLKWREMFSVRELAKSMGTATPGSLSPRQFQKLRVLIHLEGKGIWTQRQVGLAGGCGASGAAFRYLAPYRELTIRSALPFYLYIVVSTAGNPEAIASLPINCVEEHPTDPEIALLSWAKGRATSEQSLPFLRKGRNAIPSVIQDVIKMTAPIRGLAIPPEEELLFIVRKGTTSTRISTQSWHNALANFRTEHDLPFFTFSDMRSAVASLVGTQHQSKEAVSRLLQHSHQATTTRYLRSRESLEHCYERVAGFQGQLISSVTLSTKERRDLLQERGTFLGPSCADPLEGVAPGARKGEPCLQYLFCATCKNAIVVSDDPVYVARILKAKSALISLQSAAVEKVDAMVRFREVYEPILTIIDRDILSNIGSSTMNAAIEVAKALPELPMVDQ